MVIPELHTKVDIHSYFVLYTLKADEFARKHGYS